ncbi:hypothetical protein L4C54_11465 [Vibrio lamellibrachiae]|uniref:hypothetical protein n=1 Tax=Vibrio lamellibrachiae TaxID=2910253 RepID=UPI003D110740
MSNFLKLLIGSNVISLSIVFTIEIFTGILQLSFLTDYAFYSMLILVGVGSIMSFSGHKVGYSDPTNSAGVVASTLIENDSPKSFIVTKLEGTSVGHTLLLASLLPLVFCIVY